MGDNLDIHLWSLCYNSCSSRVQWFSMNEKDFGRRLYNQMTMHTGDATRHSHFRLDCNDGVFLLDYERLQQSTQTRPHSNNNNL